MGSAWRSGTMSDTPSGRATEYLSGVLDERWYEARQLLEDSTRSWGERFETINDGFDRIDVGSLPGHLRCPVPASYRRTVVGSLHSEDSPGFEAVLTHWRLDGETPIHGHPAVVMYRALSGRYCMTTYRRVADGVEKVKVIEVGAGDWLHHVGEGEHFEHFIHRVECIEEGWTLNLYSDDATKGLRYSS